MTDPGLFPEPEHTAGPTPPPAELAGLSPGRRRAVRQRQAIADGVHPLTGLPLLAEDWRLTCGQCSHRFVIRPHDRTYGKCEVRGDSRGPASDCRAWWPACARFEQRSP